MRATSRRWVIHTPELKSQAYKLLFVFSEKIPFVLDNNVHSLIFNVRLLRNLFIFIVFINDEFYVTR